MIDPAGYAWDACCLLNLLATDRAEEILRSLGAQSYVVRQVLEAEVLGLRAMPQDDPAQPMTPVDVEPLLASGALQSVDLTGDERATFSLFAAALDDGEARTAALAWRRKLYLVTDDRLSLRAAGDSSIRTLTTPDWVKRWSERATASADDLSDCLRRIQLRASYRPRRAHALYAWWQANS